MGAGHFFCRANLTEHDEKGYTIEIEAPGLGKEHVDVKLADNLLTVSGVKYAECPAQDAEMAPESSDAVSSPNNGPAGDAEPRTVLRSSRDSLGYLATLTLTRSMDQSSMG